MKRRTKAQRPGQHHACTALSRRMIPMGYYSYVDYQNLPNPVDVYDVRAVRLHVRQAEHHFDALALAGPDQRGNRHLHRGPFGGNL